MYLKNNVVLFFSLLGRCLFSDPSPPMSASTKKEARNAAGQAAVAVLIREDERKRMSTPQVHTHTHTHIEAPFLFPLTRHLCCSQPDLPPPCIEVRLL